ncbi:hypothetical protein [Synechocystis sp. CACIAM 05]|uniref:hypothetical protein n=1 Tax=Synechocystis sp. CACIAM 05 TaxID=1933929 RepID=UPI00138E8DA4|nr:hypothetical protein [Synechocystis sp. CACIAM 05]QHU99600.1 hypothetical protein BWK47_05285 [Synechocystis sp. CACIAM 05]
MFNFFVRLSAIGGMGVGTGVAIVSGAWSVLDMVRLKEANALVQQEVRRSSPARADYLYSREMTHRINVFAEGVWALGGCILYINSLALLRQTATNNKGDHSLHSQEKLTG